MNDLYGKQKSSSFLYFMPHEFSELFPLPLPLWNYMTQIRDTQSVLHLLVGPASIAENGFIKAGRPQDRFLSIPSPHSLPNHKLLSMGSSWPRQSSSPGKGGAPKLASGSGSTPLTNPPFFLPTLTPPLSHLFNLWKNPINICKWLVGNDGQWELKQASVGETEKKKKSENMWCCCSVKQSGV